MAGLYSYSSGQRNQAFAGTCDQKAVKEAGAI
jgi:hypothetical protein